MKKSIVSALIVGVGLLSFNSFAQEAKEGGEEAKKTRPVIIKFKSPSKFTIEKVRAPELRSDRLNGATRLTRENWLQLHTAFGIKGGDKTAWADDIEVSWKVFIPANVSAKQRPMLLEKTVKYLECPKEINDIPLSLYFRPSFVERYLINGLNQSDIAVALEVKVGGQPAYYAKGKSEIYLTAGGKLPPKIYWDIPQDKQHTIANKDTALLNKAETPFVNVESDKFLTIKKEE